VTSDQQRVEKLITDNCKKGSVGGVGSVGRQRRILTPELLNSFKDAIYRLSTPELLKLAVIIVTSHLN
jgi:hypothetical protein